MRTTLSLSMCAFCLPFVGRVFVDLQNAHASLFLTHNFWLYLRRDTPKGKDGSRIRNANLLADVALIRSTVPALLAEHYFDLLSLPQVQECLHSRPGRCFHLLNS